MRIAFTTLTAASGVVLLGLALFGRPDLYLQQAQQAVIGLLPAGPGGDTPDGSAVARQVAALQEQVMQLKEMLAARQTPAAPPQAAPASAPAAAPAPATSPAPQPAPPAPALSGVVASQMPAVAVPERHETLKVPPAAEPTQRPRNEAPALRKEPDDTQSVLARLRQRSVQPAAASPVPAPVAAPTPDLAARRALTLARSALMGGSVEEAIRVLQEVQLRLVFRPVTPDDDQRPVAGPGAADVARALAALGANQPRLGLQLIDRAMSDMTGAAAPVQAPVPSGGYAPAYPPR